MEQPLIVRSPRLTQPDLDRIARPFFSGLGPTAKEGAKLIAEVRKLWKERDTYRREALLAAAAWGIINGRLARDNDALRARVEELSDEVTVLRAERDLLEVEVAA